MLSPLRATALVAVVASVGVAAQPATSAPAPDGPRGAESAGLPDLSSWRISRNGFGRLRVGLPPAKIERRTGRNLRLSYRTGPCAIWTFRGVSGLSLMIVRGRLARVTAERTGRWRTSRGIGLGDSAADVRGRYPGVRSQRHAYDPGGRYLIVPGARRRVVFETDSDGRVTAFRGGRMPEVMYVEGCA